MYEDLPLTRDGETKVTVGSILLICRAVSEARGSELDAGRADVDEEQPIGDQGDCCGRMSI